MILYAVDPKGALTKGEPTEAELEYLTVDAEGSWYFSSPAKAYAKALQRRKLELVYARRELQRAARYVNQHKAAIAQIKLGMKELKK